MATPDHIPPTLPLHMARAYGLARPALDTAGAKATPALESATPPSGPPGGARRRLSTLVGAIVPGSIDFRAGGPVPSVGLPLYRHPADRNAAATGVALGRKLDVNG